jgi:hypothetical protein
MAVSYPIDLRHPAATPLVGGRKVLFLDLSIWIRLTRRRTAEDAAAADRLVELVKGGRVFCPVSWPLLSELHHGHNFESALPIAQLMDELCNGLSFTNDTELISSEIEQYVRDLVAGTESGLTADEIYVSVSGFLSRQTNIVWPDEFPAPADERLAVTIQMANRISALTVTDYIQMGRDDLPLPDTNKDPEYQRAWQERFDFSKGDRKVMRRVEEEYALKSWFLPELQQSTSKLSFLQRLTFNARLQALPLNHYQRASTAMLERMPAARTKIELMAIMGFNPNRKGSVHDFYDVHQMIAPLAYADAYVAHDRWIRHLLTRETDILSRNGVTYLPDVPALSRWLDELDATKEPQF